MRGLMATPGRSRTKHRAGAKSLREIAREQGAHCASLAPPDGWAGHCSRSFQPAWWWEARSAGIHWRIHRAGV